MEVRYLLDENMASEWRTQLLRNRPDLMVWMIGDPSVPGQGTLDPEILRHASPDFHSGLCFGSRDDF